MHNKHMRPRYFKEKVNFVICHKKDPIIYTKLAMRTEDTYANMPADPEYVK